MKFTEALDRLNAIYIPGAVAFFAAKTPDPWQEMHDKLEKVILMNDCDLEAIACEHFLRKAEELLAEYRASGEIRRGVSPLDGFHMTPERVGQWDSRTRKRCAVCDSKDNLKIRPVGPDAMDVQVVCKDHWNAGLPLPEPTPPYDRHEVRHWLENEPGQRGT